ncbi:MAG: TIGR01440 family protein [Oscillospiraceae bacterium]|nr:TIGR01440 family protein [Oscillospiraceae bacterium]
MENVEFDALRAQAAAAAEELLDAARLSAGQILVVGCSTSEIMGMKIGTGSNEEAAQAVLGGILDVCSARGVRLAAQCCEHLNRAIIVERDAVPNAYVCNAVPKTHAGGSFAAAAYAAFADPVALEGIQADAGLDIGCTLIGMHLKPVAVPVRLKNCEVGCAHVTAARTRPKYIGGARAMYDERLF